MRPFVGSELLRDAGISGMGLQDPAQLPATSNCGWTAERPSAYLTQNCSARLEWKVADMAYYQTRYEVIAENKDGIRWLVGFCRIPSRTSLIRLSRSRGQSLVNLTGISQFTCEGKGRLGHKVILGDWTIRYSGRTMLESKQSPLQTIE